MKNGYEVTFAAMSGDDVVLLDIKLAGTLNEIQTGRKIRKYHDQIALVYITSYSQQNVRNLAAETTPSGCLIKPINKDALLEAVAEALEN